MFASHRSYLNSFISRPQAVSFFVANLLYAKVMHASILSQSLSVSVIRSLLAIALAVIRTRWILRELKVGCKQSILLGTYN